MARKSPNFVSIEFTLPDGHATLTLPKLAEGERCGAVVLVAGPAASEDEIACLNELALALPVHGLAIARLDQQTSSLDGVFRAIVAAIDQTAIHSLIDGARIGLLGIGVGAAVAAVLAQRRTISRLCLLGPVAPEVASRRADPGADPVEANIIRELAELQPLRSFVNHQGAALVLIGAADTTAPIGHSLAFSAAREYAERAVDHHQIAFADHAFSDPSSRESMHAVVVEFFSAMAETEELAPT